MTLPLEGIRVIDFTLVQQGPTCTMILGDYGAEVIKVEPVGTGEFYRHWHDLNRGLGNPWLSLNRNKKSIAVNLKQPEGREVIHRLAKVSDVVVENFRPGVMDRLGIGYAALREINPRLIFASSSGYGQTGPYSKWKGQDLAGQGVAGLPLLNGFDGDPPIAISPPIADFTAGNLLAQGILLALLAREKTGRGQFLETALMHGMIAINMQSLTSAFNAEKPRRGTRRKRTNVWPYAFYQTKAGPLLMATNMFTDNYLAKYCAALGIEDLTAAYPTEAEQNEHGAEIHAKFQEAFLTKTTEEWLRILGDYDVLAAPVNSPQELEQDPQVQHSEMVIEVEHPHGGTYRTVGFPIKLSDTPAAVTYGPPRLGEHTEEVLQLLGYAADEVAGLAERRVVERAAADAATDS